MSASALVKAKAESMTVSMACLYSSHACPAVLASSAASAVASARLPWASAASWVSPVRPWVTSLKACCEDSAVDAVSAISP